MPMISVQQEHVTKKLTYKKRQAEYLIFPTVHVNYIQKMIGNVLKSESQFLILRKMSSVVPFPENLKKFSLTKQTNFKNAVS